MSTPTVVEKVLSVIEMDIENFSPAQQGEILELLIDKLQDRLDDLNGEDET